MFTHFGASFHRFCQIWGTMPGDEPLCPEESSEGYAPPHAAAAQIGLVDCGHVMGQSKVDVPGKTSFGTFFPKV